MMVTALILSGCNKNNTDIPFNPVTARSHWNTKQHSWQQSELKILEQGRRLYKVNCGGCHGSDGLGDRLIGAPALKNNSIVKGQSQQHIQIVLYGKPNRSMPAYKSSLNNQQLAAIISYERNAWGNNSYQIIHPQQIEQQRNIQ